MTYTRTDYQGSSAFISVASPECLGGMHPYVTGGYGSNVWVTANKGYFFPFTIQSDFVVTKAFWYNGNAVSGTVDVGVYNSSLARLCSTGLITQAGVSVVQEAEITDTTLTRGVYFLAISCSTVSAQFIRSTLGDVRLHSMMGIFDMASAHPLPATATMAARAADIVPWFGISNRTLIA